MTFFTDAARLNLTLSRLFIRLETASFRRVIRTQKRVWTKKC